MSEVARPNRPEQANEVAAEPVEGAAARAEALARTLSHIRDSALREGMLSLMFTTSPMRDAAELCDAVACGMERADPLFRETQVALVCLFARDPALVALLREAALRANLLSLARLVGPAEESTKGRRKMRSEGRHEASVHGSARPLTLGERKSLARKPQWVHRLLSDPHPEVVARVLLSPRITEPDVIRLVAKRPGNPNALAEIARSSRWLQSARVRVALCAHPDTPPATAAHIATLLLRQELREVLATSTVPKAVRVLCFELLGRRPPMPRSTPPSSTH